MTFEKQKIQTFEKRNISMPDPRLINGRGEVVGYVRWVKWPISGEHPEREMDCGA
jgi:hypothetical protein